MDAKTVLFVIIHHHEGPGGIARKAFGPGQTTDSRLFFGSCNSHFGLETRPSGVAGVRRGLRVSQVHRVKWFNACAPPVRRIPPRLYTVLYRLCTVVH